MSALAATIATIAGFIITGYSAYRIQAARRGKGRKLRDMEVLRRLNVPPRKQVRAWGFLLVLGLLLLSPSLGFLLSCDQTAGDGGIGECSNLRATPSGSPVTAPPSVKLDHTPRTFDEDGSNGRAMTIGGSSGGGGGGKKSSSGGGKTAPSTASPETATSDGNSGAVPGAEAGSSDGGGSPSEVSGAEETPVIYKADPASDGPVVAADSEGDGMPGADESVEESGEQKSPVVPQNGLDESDGPAEIAPSDGGSELPEASMEAEAAEPEASKEYVAVESSAGDLPEEGVHPEDVDEGVQAGDLPGEGVNPEDLDEGVPVQGAAGSDENRLQPGRSETESATIDAAREKRTAPDASRLSAAQSLPGSSSAEVLREPAVLDPSSEERTLQEGPEPPETEFQATSDPSDSEFERELPKAEPPSAGIYPAEPIGPAEAAGENDSEVEETDSSSIADPTLEADPEIGLLETNSTINDEVKKLEFKANIAGSASAYPSGNSSSSKLEGALNQSAGRPEVDVLGRRLDFDGELENFASFSQPEMGMERNNTSSSVMLMEFEGIDLGSKPRGGLGLTPTSPFA